MQPQNDNLVNDSSPSFVMIPRATATSFPPDFGYLNSKHDATAPPDDKAHLHTVGLQLLRPTLTQSAMLAQWLLSACRPSLTTHSS